MSHDPPPTTAGRSCLLCAQPLEGDRLGASCTNGACPNSRPGSVRVYAPLPHAAPQTRRASSADRSSPLRRAFRGVR